MCVWQQILFKSPGHTNVGLLTFLRDTFSSLIHPLFFATFGDCKIFLQ